MDIDKKNAILHHPQFVECYSRIAKEEDGRIFCRHDITHFLDVARLMMILNAKEHLHISEDVIYGAALVHDIGRHLQYSHGIDHALASAMIAKKILKDSGFDKAEISTIVQAVLSHRSSSVRKKADLRGLLYRADKMSRACFACPVRELCNWPDDKMNLTLQF